MSASPFGVPAAQHVSVWTGKEILIWEVDNRSGVAGRGAAYDPDNDRWRTLSASPAWGGSTGPVLVWDGQRVLAWFAARPTATGGSTQTSLFAFDVRSDRWSPLASGPLDVTGAAATWTGAEMVLVGWLTNSPSGLLPHGTVYAAAFNPNTNLWRALPSPPWDPSERGSPITLSAVAGDVVAYTSGLQSAVFTTSTSTWRVLPPLPETRQECYPTAAALSSGTVMGYYCGTVTSFSLKTGAWSDSAPPFEAEARGPGAKPVVPVAAGDRFILWGSLAVGRPNAAWTYAPPGSGR